MAKKVLFLCSGNYYRSRFAEVYFNWHAEQRGIAWRAESRGLALDPFNLGSMSRHTVARLQGHGIACDAYQRSPQDAAHEDFAGADLIVAVKRTEHHPLMQLRFPSWLDRVEFWEVHDLDCSTAEEAMSHLERELAGLLDRLAQAEQPDSARAAH